MEGDIKLLRQDNDQLKVEIERLRFESITAELTIAGYKQMENDYKILREDHMNKYLQHYYINKSKRRRLTSNQVESKGTRNHRSP